MQSARRKGHETYGTKRNTCVVHRHRFPVMSPKDIELWTANKPPEMLAAGPIEDDTMVCSASATVF